MSFKSFKFDEIPKNWKSKRVNDYVELLTDYVANGSFASLKKNVIYYDQPNYAILLRLTDYNNRFDGNFVFIDKNAYNFLSKTKLFGNEIIISNVGANVGTVFRAPKLNYRMNLGPNSIMLKTKGDDDFYYYWFLSQVGQESIKSILSGSAQPKFNKTSFRTLEIPVPPIEEQKSIANILLRLDEKIEINNQINKKLEEMAQVIFKRWFIDFEFPCVPENYKFSGAGKPADFNRVCTYKKVGGLPVPDGESWFVYVLLCDDGSFYKGMTKDLYRRFYEHYTGNGAEWTKAHKPVKVIHYERFNTQQEARKREEELKSSFGREWIKREYQKYIEDEKNMHEAITEKAGSPAHEYTRKSKLMIAGEMVESEMRMIPKGWKIKKLSDLCDIITKSEKPFNNPGTLYEHFSIPAYDAGKVQKVEEGNKISSNKYKIDNDCMLISKLNPSTKRIWDPNCNSENAICSTEFIVYKPKRREIKPFLYEVINSDKFSEFLMSNVTGSTGSRQRVQPKLTLNYNILLIEEMVLSFCKLIKPIQESIKLNIHENVKLTKVRDVLLPKLMSGEIRVTLEK